MNVLEAVNKLDKLDRDINSLVRVIMKLEGDTEFRSEVKLINEIKNGFVKEAELLKQRLENTQLNILR